MTLHFVLDGLTSASNLGTIFRVADALCEERLWLAGSSVNLQGSRFRRPPAPRTHGHRGRQLEPGLSSEVLALFHEVVALPMLGQGNSINVSNALAAVAYWVAAGGCGK